LIRLIIVLILFFPMNGVFSGCADAVSVSAGEVSSFSYEREDFSLNTEEIAFLEEIQEEEEAVLVATYFCRDRLGERFVWLEPRHWKHVSKPQINASFYTNLPPPVSMV